MQFTLLEHTEMEGNAKMNRIIHKIMDENGLKSIIKNISNEMIPQASIRMGITYDDLKKRLDVQLGLGEEINAYANPSATRITINWALMIFYHKLLKVFATTLTVGDKSTRVLTKRTVSPENLIYSAKPPYC